MQCTSACLLVSETKHKDIGWVRIAQPHRLLALDRRVSMPSFLFQITAEKRNSNE